LGSLVEVQDSDDPEGLRVFYYLVQDLKVRWYEKLIKSSMTLTDSFNHSSSCSA
jgi:hypothetical protein